MGAAAATKTNKTKTNGNCRVNCTESTNNADTRKTQVAEGAEGGEARGEGEKGAQGGLQDAGQQQQGEGKWPQSSLAKCFHPISLLKEHECK